MKSLVNKLLLGASAVVALSGLPKESDGQNGSGTWVRIDVPSHYSVYRDGGNVVFLDKTSCYARTENLSDVKRVNDRLYVVYDENGNGLWHDNSYYVDGCSNSGNYSEEGFNISKEEAIGFGVGLGIGIIGNAIENARKNNTTNRSNREPRQKYVDPNAESEGGNVESSSGFWEDYDSEGSSSEGFWGKEDSSGFWEESQAYKENSKADKKNSKRNGFWEKEPSGKNKVAETSSLAYGMGEEIYSFSEPFLKEIPYVGDAIGFIDIAKNMQGKSNPVHNRYQKNLKEANNFIYGQDEIPENSKLAEFFEGTGSLRNCYSCKVEGGLGKILIHKSLGSPDQNDLMESGLRFSMPAYMK